MINDGKTKTGRGIFLQEFLELVEKNGRFEFIGWCNSFYLERPIEKRAKFSRPITLLRRK